MPRCLSLWQSMEGPTQDLMLETYLNQTHMDTMWMTTLAPRKRKRSEGESHTEGVGDISEQFYLVQSENHFMGNRIHRKIMEGNNFPWTYVCFLKTFLKHFFLFPRTEVPNCLLSPLSADGTVSVTLSKGMVLSGILGMSLPLTPTLPYEVSTLMG